MITIYDSLRGEKLPFQKDPKESIKMYVCGPTVYDRAHLGHGRSAVAFDVIRRYLEVFGGYQVDFAFNITDIDDKMIDRAKQEGISVAELAKRLIPEYAADYAALGVKPPTFNPRATEFVSQMVELIEKLEKKGAIYVLPDGVYYDVKAFPEYGKLSHQDLAALNVGARVAEHEGKRNPQDFVLWKLKKEGEPSWPSPWGEGRPGWHIECSAMSTSLLGETLDIHGGGLDLKFPHHECEVAQSEKANDKPFAHIWMHNGYVTVNDEKMSKSLNNFFTLQEIFQRYKPRLIRFFLLGTHYRSPIEFNFEVLEQARGTLRRLDEFYLRHQNENSTEKDEGFLHAFQSKMENDFDTSGAISEIFEWMKQASPEKVIPTLLEVNEVLQIFPVDFQLTTEQKNLIQLREDERQLKNWQGADELRKELQKQGIEIEDSPTGPLARPLL